MQNKANAKHVKPINLHGSNPLTNEVLHSFGELYWIWWNSLQKRSKKLVSDGHLDALWAWTPVDPWRPCAMYICVLPIWCLDVFVMSSSWSSQRFRRVAQIAARSSIWRMQRTIWEQQTCKTNSSWLLIQSRSRLPVNFLVIHVASCCTYSNIWRPIHWWNVCCLEWHSSLTLCPLLFFDVMSFSWFQCFPLVPLCFLHLFMFFSRSMAI